MTGRTIGNYRVIAKVGEGGMGKVYRAVDTMVEREVALKSLKPEIAAQPGIVERFRSEAVLLARLNHPNIAQLYTFFKDGDEYYMVMEYVAGDTLQTTIQKNGAISVTRALGYVSQILQGVGHAHALGVLHRDLKPANLMITPADRVKIMDFGIARVLGAAGMTRDGRVIGTLEYLAPERIRGKQDDPRSDLYSIGVVLYQMLTGHLPFEADSDYDLLTAQIQKQPPRPSDIGVELTPEVEMLLLQSLEKNPDRRFSDAAAFEAAVNALLPGQRPPTPISKSKIDTRLARLIGQTRSVSDSKEIPLVRPASAETAVPPVPPSTRPSGSVPPLPAPPAPAASAAAMPTPPKSSGGSGKIAAIVAAAVAGLVLLGGGGFLFWQKFVKRPPVPAATLATAPSMPSAAPAPAPAEPPSDMVVTPSDSDAAAANTPGAAGGAGLFPVTGGRPKTAGTPKKSPPDTGKSKPVDLPPAPVGAVGASVAEIRRAVMTALDEADGPAQGDPGVRPIQMAGLIAALKVGGSPMEGDIEQAIGRRGVSFQLTPAQSDALRTAGASEAFIKVVDGNYYARDSITPKPAAKGDAAPTIPKPAPHIAKVGDARSIFVECGQDDMRGAIRDEIKKQFGGKLQLMDAASGSDVVMKVSLTGPNGGSVTRALGLKDHAQIHAIVVDGASGNTVWEQDAGDRKPILGIFQGDTMKRLASRIVKELKDSMAKK